MKAKSGIILSAVTILILFTAASSAGYTNNAFAATSPIVSSAAHKSSSISHTGVTVKLTRPQIHTADNLIFDGGVSDLSAGNDMSAFIQANDFQLSKSQVITDVHLETGELAASSGPTGTTWIIYADDGGKPGAQIATGNTANLVRTDEAPWFDVYDVISYSFNLDNPVTLGPGTYWLGLHFAKDFTSFDSVYWLNGADSGAKGQEEDGGVLPWTTTTDGEVDIDHAFQLTGHDVAPTEPVSAVGGMGIPIDTTALLLAGVQGSALWMIPAVVVAGAGIGIFSFKKSKKKHD